MTTNFDNFKNGISAFRMYKHRRKFFSGLDRIRGIYQLSKAVDEGGEATRMRLLDALGWSSPSEATDPKDKIFGILGLCCDGSNLVPAPDYRNSLDTILRELRMAELRQAANRNRHKTRPMDLICLDNPKIQKRAEFPSWVHTLFLRIICCRIFIYLTH